MDTTGACLFLLSQLHSGFISVVNLELLYVFYDVKRYKKKKVTFTGTVMKGCLNVGFIGYYYLNTFA